jgi:hypothetical protein
MATSKDDLLTPADVEAEYKIPKSTQAKRRMSGDFVPYLKVGRVIRYWRNDVIAWFDAHRRHSTSDTSRSHAP